MNRLEKPTFSEEPPPPILEDIERTAPQGKSFAEWGDGVIDDLLRIIRDDPLVFGPRVLKKLEASAIPGSLAEGYPGLSGRDQANYISLHKSQIFDSETLSFIGQNSIDNPIVDQVDLPVSELRSILDQGSGRVIKLYSQLLSLTGVVPNIDQVQLTLFTDGQRLPLVERNGAMYVVRFKNTTRSVEDLSEDCSSLPGEIPPTEVFPISEDEVAFLTNKVNVSADQALSAEDVIATCWTVAESVGFVPDINDDNVMLGSDANLYYVDGDIFDHLATKGFVELSSDSRALLKEGEAKYRSGNKRI